jgi:hypothetical protein
VQALSNARAAADPAAAPANSANIQLSDTSAADVPAAGLINSTTAQASNVSTSNPAASAPNSTTTTSSNISTTNDPGSHSNNTSAPASNTTAASEPAAGATSSNTAPSGDASAGTTGLAALIANITEPIVAGAQAVETVVVRLGHTATAVGQAVSAWNETFHQVLPASLPARLFDWVAGCVRAAGFDWMQRSAFTMYLLLNHLLAWYLLLCALDGRQQQFDFDARAKVIKLFRHARRLNVMSSVLAVTTLGLFVVSSLMPAVMFLRAWHTLDLIACICHVAIFLCLFSMQFTILRAFAPTEERLAQNVQRFFDEEAARAKAATICFLGGAAGFGLTGLGVGVDLFSCSLLRSPATRFRVAGSYALLAFSSALSWGWACINAQTAVRPASVSPELLQKLRVRFCEVWIRHIVVGYIAMSVHAAYNLVVFVVQNQKVFLVPDNPTLLRTADMFFTLLAVCMLLARFVYGSLTLNRVAAFNLALHSGQASGQDSGQASGQETQGLLQDIATRIMSSLPLGCSRNERVSHAHAA